MKRFRYRAVAANGAVHTGVLEAASPLVADAVLIGRGLNPVAVSEHAEPPRFWNRPSRRDLALAFRSIASLVEAGAPLRVALETAEQLLPRGGARAALPGVRQGLVEGMNLCNALERSGLLPPALLGVVRAGERAGRLESALGEAAVLLESEAAAAARLQRALTYPCIVLVAGLVSVAIISLVVVPRFVALLIEAGRSLPRSTQLLITIVGGVRGYGWYLMLSAIAGMVLLWRWSRHPRNLEIVHRGLRFIPGLGAFRLASASATVTRSLGGALRAGAPLLPALDIALDSLSDASVRRRLERAIPQIAAGGKLTTVLAAEGVLIPSVLPLVGLGESSGRLSDMALRASDVARAEADRLLDLSITLIEPGLVLALGAVIAFVAGAMFQVVYGLGPVP